MKRIFFSVAALTFLSATTISAQDTYDVARLNSSDLNGTARYIGMGGAMGALGGDLTSISTNPAGLGIYRSNDVAGTLSMSVLDNQTKDSKNRVSFDQFGLAISMPYSNYSSLKYVNFGFNYRKKKNFFNNDQINSDWNGDFSQSFQIANLCNEAIDQGVTNSNNFGALAGAAAQVGIVGKEENGKYKGYGAYDTYYRLQQTGGISQYDFSMAVNLSDQVFLGLSVGLYDVRFDRSVGYTEYDGDDYSYDMYNRYRTRGQGVDVKLGAIFRPIVDSNFRVGFAITTPTWYTLTDENGVDMSTYDANDKEIASGYAAVDPVDYQLRTPWKFNVNLGHTIGSVVAIGAEYEYEDYSSIYLTEPDGYESYYTDYVNRSTKTNLKGVSTVRLGIEVKPIPEFCIRAGYNYSSGIFDKNAYRSLYYSDINSDTFTETSYRNVFDLNRFTCGLGFRSNKFYADLAYQYTVQKADFYAFDDSYENSNGAVTYLPATKNDGKRHQISLTLGYRF